jgi:gamma-glutamyl-gamma-aminobutyraldehyde dehydrogenase
MKWGQLFIAGGWRAPASGSTYETINPATEEPSAQVGRGDERHVDLAVAAARQAARRQGRPDTETVWIDLS